MSILAGGTLSGKYKLKQRKLTPLVVTSYYLYLMDNGFFHFISPKPLPVLTVFGAIGQAANALLAVVGAP